MQKLFEGIYRGKTVLVTGHTGFKGSWLSLWLLKMGANVIGYSQEPMNSHSHYELLNLEIVSIIADINDTETLEQVFHKYQPEIVFHLAAQALVRASYKNPVETFQTNIMGTINIFEAARKIDSVKAIINITSDKAYENKEWLWGYRENDAMGGYDPYSASKGCSELVTTSYRNSFFNPSMYNKTHKVLLASCRAGNVIGGGDWSEDRLIPDIMKSVEAGDVVSIRNPNATRPWQHVLEPLSGYLSVGEKLLHGDKNYASAWNFGPLDEGSISVETVVKNIKLHWDKIVYEIKEELDAPHEANLLKLDCSKAHTLLNWQSVWNSDTTFQKTTLWYKKYALQKELNTLNDLLSYVDEAKKKGLLWAN